MIIKSTTFVYLVVVPGILYGIRESLEYIG